MNDREVEKRIIDIAKEELEEDNISVDLTREQCEKWDSIMQLILVSSFESEFAVRFDSKEIQGISSLIDFKKAIIEKQTKK